MQPPFDIAADLDTPVSAYLKLGDLAPRFLLESVEGGERLARYSFLGFGDALELRYDDEGLRVGDDALPTPGNRDDWLGALRDAADLHRTLGELVAAEHLGEGTSGVAVLELLHDDDQVRVVEGRAECV